MLTVSHFPKSYSGGKRAVDDLSFTAPRGTITGFIGHNGAGKSTTLRCAAGILDFSEGEIRIGGHDVRTEPVAAKSITAFLPDNPDLYDFMTGIQYLNFIADIYSIPSAERTRRVEKYAGAFDILSVLGSQIGSYSHGMKQKLALVSALIREPQLLMLDEPFVGLDPQASHVMKGFLREVCDRGGSVLFSTHILEVAQKLCDRIVIIRGGQLVEEGFTAEVVGNSDLESVFLELAEEGGGDA